MDNRQITAEEVRESFEKMKACDRIFRVRRSLWDRILDLRWEIGTSTLFYMIGLIMEIVGIYSNEPMTFTCGVYFVLRAEIYKLQKRLL